MFLKSHIWNHVPHYGHETRKEMRVRESTHTVMLFDKKYYDVETGKYITDKLQTIYSESYSDLVESGYGDSGYDNRYKRISREKANKQIEEFSPVYKIPLFKPKDNDFDYEAKKTKRLSEFESHILKSKHEQQRIEQLELRKKEEELQLIIKQECAYQEYVRKREMELIRNRAVKEMDKMKIIGNIRPNKWRPK